MRQKKPLYRSVNTRTRGVFHRSGGDYRWSRRREDRVHDGAMRGKQRRGLDYTPLFKFLLSRLGEDWDAVHAEAVARLDRPEPIFWMVARSDTEKSPFVLIGENAYYSGLFVDADNRLRQVDPDLRVEHMEPGCACCTHTFNGVPFTRKYDPSAD
ncbi:hypothetical protein GR138_21590 [Shinella kummerowiae]|jgi:hypothetical protein|uniref:Uncharacterized protein n=1 Tax=Shinella kummerowiae TaxID=417745 RepID=A0A6N8SGV5_9HYPH|nr:hypothetical protein [Shinella kummerowiae]MXN47803.1 hypothetical protein [Shinella kummerowiae]